MINEDIGTDTNFSQKRRTDQFEERLEVRQALKKMKPIMMEPYISSGKLLLCNG